MLPVRPDFRVVCLSHLMWEETLFQRPQQLMSRLARAGRPVVYVSMIGTRRWLRLRGRAPMSGVTADGLRFRTLAFMPLVSRLKAFEGVNRRLPVWAARREMRQLPDAPTVLWLYHPDLVSAADRLPHDILVYDVMDHFRAFRKSSRGIEAREAELLRRADVVFTGGRSMHEDKVGARPDAICLPSGVDVEHFGRALLDETPLDDAVARLPRPRLGYVGAIDERIDWPLVEAVCRARPDWSYVFVGPVIDGAEPLVASPNLHLLGARPYARLPEALKGFDVATIPWVRSELTDHMSPTKTPEYLAAGRPVVSMPVPDVARDYGDVVALAGDAEAFVTACEAAVANPRADLAAALADRAAAASWDAIAGKMADTICRRLAEKRVTP